MNNIKKFLAPLFFIGMCLLAGVIGSIFTTDAIPTWYADLTKPSFNPPNWLFAPVWTSLYILMGIAGYLISQVNEKKVKKIKRKSGTPLVSKKEVMYIFWAQLFLNTMWSIIFFGQKDLLLGLFEIVILWGTIFVLIVSSSLYSKTASLLLVPYLAWVSFATVLNGALWYLN